MKKTLMNLSPTVLSLIVMALVMISGLWCETVQANSLNLIKPKSHELSVAASEARAQQLELSQQYSENITAKNRKLLSVEVNDEVIVAINDNHID